MSVYLYVLMAVDACTHLSLAEMPLLHKQLESIACVKNCRPLESSEASNLMQHEGITAITFQRKLFILAVRSGRKLARVHQELSSQMSTAKQLLNQLKTEFGSIIRLGDGLRDGPEALKARNVLKFGMSWSIVPLSF